MNQNYKYLIAVIIGVLVTLLLFKTCDQNKGQNRGDEIKIDTIYKVTEKQFHFNDTIIKMKYNDRYYTTKEIQYQIEDKIDTGWVSLPYSDYIFKYDTIQYHKYGQSKISINGWGYINKIDIDNKFKDTTVYIKEDRIINDNKSHLYLGPTYSLNKNIGLGLDWNIKDKVIISTNINYNDITKQPDAGIGLKLKIK